jgi:hypothetical protein
MHKNRWIKICGDLATASKHFILTTRKNPMTSEATSSRGYGVGRYGKGGWGTGEEAIEIELVDGSHISGLDLVQNVIQAWETFFQSHAL